MSALRWLATGCARHPSAAESNAADLSGCMHGCCFGNLGLGVASRLAMPRRKTCCLNGDLSAAADAFAAAAAARKLSTVWIPCARAFEPWPAPAARGVGKSAPHTDASWPAWHVGRKRPVLEPSSVCAPAAEKVCTWWTTSEPSLDAIRRALSSTRASSRAATSCLTSAERDSECSCSCFNNICVEMSSSSNSRRSVCPRTSCSWKPGASARASPKPCSKCSSRYDSASSSKLPAHRRGNCA
mmetsp:Transcript_60801/g.169992  ORF Transcript_60801/g.169992 Transcript_60801/m.169992 type:complete len:242 (-) Transcript_60801:1060-1785(-)